MMKYFLVCHSSPSHSHFVTLKAKQKVHFIDRPEIEREGRGQGRTSRENREGPRTTTAFPLSPSLLLFVFFQFAHLRFFPVELGLILLLFSMPVLADLLSDPRYAVAALVLLATLAILLKKSSSSRSSSSSDSDSIVASVPKPLETFTLAHVAAHNSKEDAWIVIDSGVYDITPYVTEHPGGVEAILRNAGGDATKGFKGPQHPARVFDMIDDYKIGVVASSSSS